MLILFDNNVPRGLARALAGHTIREARQHGWDRLQNGELLRVAEEAGFHVIVTSDKNIRYQQNLADRTIALVVLTQGRWNAVRKRLFEITLAVKCRNARQLHRSRYSSRIRLLIRTDKSGTDP